ncbi:aminotransferase class I/II-fold pyridoxal phosphate-dependent enzyme [Marininema halotolerans]|uniref:Histidinol-phosphate aminotransferase n=1 Tax=Marininema halotolerans TaxID=1155944 RepID=A0A1I6TKZ6_9BACL|nr:aminotransferase class I/II-fold pyridoxal phosphate-dependent enzyme [Marininema halotolerans]SFS89923.1 histidinol-phosphate aminotransferase [Marininema halotolerans]
MKRPNMSSNKLSHHTERQKESQINHPSFSSIVKALPATVPFVPPEEMERQTGHSIRLRLGANESNFGMSPKARQAMEKAVGKSYLYGDATSYDLKGELATLHGIRTDQIVIGSGLDDLLGLIVRTFLNPGDAVTTSLGGYPTFNFHVQGYGGVLHTVPYQDFRNDLQGLLQKAHDTHSRILYLANPDNPTGSWWGAEAIGELRRSLPKGCLLLLDEAYIDFAPLDTIWPLDPSDPQVIRARTFSKSHGMAGARIGYAFANQETIQAFDKIRNHFGVNRAAQAGALASLQDTAFQRMIMKEVAKGKEEYATLAAELGISTLPSATNFVAFDMGTPKRAKLAMDTLWKQGVFTRVPGAPPLNRLLRVSVGTPVERSEFARILQEVVPTLS